MRFWQCAEQRHALFLEEARHQPIQCIGIEFGELGQVDTRRDAIVALAGRELVRQRNALFAANQARGEVLRVEVRSAVSQHIRFGHLQLLQLRSAGIAYEAPPAGNRANVMGQTRQIETLASLLANEQIDTATTRLPFVEAAQQSFVVVEKRRIDFRPLRRSVRAPFRTGAMALHQHFLNEELAGDFWIRFRRTAGPPSHHGQSIDRDPLVDHRLATGVVPTRRRKGGLLDVLGGGFDPRRFQTRHAARPSASGVADFRRHYPAWRPARKRRCGKQAKLQPPCAIVVGKPTAFWATALAFAPMFAFGFRFAPMADESKRAAQEGAMQGSVIGGMGVQLHAEIPTGQTQLPMQRLPLAHTRRAKETLLQQAPECAAA